MSKTKWTPEQQRAIDTKEGNILVAAAAGSGKTAVLVERIIDMVCNDTNPINIDEILVTTFTNAAALEMKERVGIALSKKIEEGKNVKRLQKQLTLINKASIVTIHAFCLDIIKNNFHLLNINPNFRIADDAEVTIMKSEVLDELLENKYELIDESDDIKGEEYKVLVDYFCDDRGDKKLKDIILRVYTSIMSLPEPKVWLDESAESYNADQNFKVGESRWGNIIAEDIIKRLQQHLNKYKKAVAVIEESNAEKYKPLIKEEMTTLEYCISLYEDNIEDFLRNVSKIKFGKLPTEKKDVSEEVKSLYKSTRNAYKDEMKKIQPTVDAMISGEIVEKTQSLYPVMRALSNVVGDFIDKFAQVKKEKGVIDFSDFEHYALQLLLESNVDGTFKKSDGEYVPSSLATSLREKYATIFIDEYQDSSMIQEVILDSVSRRRTGKPNVFMVGDIKQSIYRFRKAEPTIFLKKYNTYSEDRESDFQKILLYKNFRSREKVLSTINDIFKSIMSEYVGGLDYTDKESLNPGATFGEISEEKGKVLDNMELHLIDCPKGDAEDISNVQAEARMVATRIKELMSKDENGHGTLVYDGKKGAYRELKYRDIVILMRAVSSTAKVFEDEFIKQDIPLYTDVDRSFFKNIEVKTILSLLKIIDNPYQDIPLVGVMRSPIGGFTEKELSEIKAVGEKERFYDCMLAMDELEIDKSLREKIDIFKDKLLKWRKLCSTLTLSELIWGLYKETGYYGFVGSLPNGTVKQANLRALFEKARKVEDTSYDNVFKFVTLMENLEEGNKELGVPKDIGEEDDVVRIMTIHKSKGLEFPVVFVSNLNKKFNMMDNNNFLLVDQQLGYGVDYKDLDNRIESKMIMKEAIKTRNTQEILSEEMRVLYVALTRAKEKLILTGVNANLEGYLNKFIAKISTLEEVKQVPENDVLMCNSFLDWIVLSILTNIDGRNGIATKVQQGNVVEDSIYKGTEWDIRYWQKDNLIEEITEDREEKVSIRESIYEISKEEDLSLKDEINKILSYEYKFKQISNVPTAVTVTELKNKNIAKGNEKEDLYNIPTMTQTPKFMKDIDEVSGAEKGTAIHDCMSYLDLVRIKDADNLEEEVKAQIEKLVKDEFITEKQKALVKANAITNFFTSDIGERAMKCVKDIHREREFKYYTDELVKASIENKDVSTYLEDDDITIIRGIIDMYFIEDNDIVIVDYKSDRVRDENILIERYKEQLNEYSEAIEALTKKKVKEKHIYSFHLNKSIEVR